MIKKNTVFILGAGASAPFGFPTGFGLRTEICSLATVGSNASAILTDSGTLASYTFEGFVKAFLDSGLNSIDSFLSRNPQYAEVGRQAIAACILARENEEGLFRVGGELGNSDWYGLLWNVMVDQIIDLNHLIPANNVSFITFNYDRSLEVFLHTAISNTFGVNDRDADNVLKNIKIHHVYGSLGAFMGWDNGSYGITHDTWKDQKSFDLAWKGISVIPAQRGQGYDNEAITMLSNAENVVFLGFGFDATNCARLKLPEVLNSRTHAIKRVYATAKSLTESELARAASLSVGDGTLLAEAMIFAKASCYDALRLWGVLHD